jgi:tRNA-2-methylthio-N6-dimethylallyladenosine synthase
MTDQVPPDVVRERFERLLAMQNSHSLAAHQALIGQTAEILIEGISDTAPDILSGRTASGKLINFTIPPAVEMPGEARLPDGLPDGSLLEGRLALVRLVKAKTFSIEGEMERLLP